jgi:hypothetical protein
MLVRGDHARGVRDPALQARSRHRQARRLLVVETAGYRQLNAFWRCQAMFDLAQAARTGARCRARGSIAPAETAPSGARHHDGSGWSSASSIAALAAAVAIFVVGAGSSVARGSSHGSPAT